MEEAYEKSIQMIKETGLLLTEKEYNKLAKKFDLLNSESLQYMSKMKFKKLNKKLLFDNLVCQKVCQNKNIL